MNVAKADGSAPLCPSAQPEWHGSVAFGVMQGSASEPRLEHLPQTVAVDQRLLDLCAPVTPTEVFRFAAPCLQGRCEHFRDRKCGLATQLVALLPSVSEDLPACAIRMRCRWWLQEGAAACARCPQVVTDNHNASPQMQLAATPGLGLPAEVRV